MNNSYKASVEQQSIQSLDRRERGGIGRSPEINYAWLLLALLFGGSVLNYLDRAVLGVVMPWVRRDLSLSNTDYGVVVNPFLLLYMVFYIVGGRVSDRLGCRRSFIVNVIAWSAASMLQALSRGLVSLCAYRGLLGAAEGGFYPTAIRGSPSGSERRIGPRQSVSCFAV